MAVGVFSYGEKREGCAVFCADVIVCFLQICILFLLLEDGIWEAVVHIVWLHKVSSSRDTKEMKIRRFVNSSHF